MQKRHLESKYNNSQKPRTQKKYTKKKSLNGFATALLLFSAFVPASFYSYAKFKTDRYVDNHLTFDSEKVNYDIDYYGGDSRYIAQNSIFFKNRLCNHFNIGKNRPIKVGFSSKVTEQQKQQFSYTFDYLNQVFAVINDKYKFEFTNSTSKGDCDIYVDLQPMSEKIGATTYSYFDKINACCIKSAEIFFNSAIELSDNQLKFYMAHEMMHVLFGSGDVNEKESETFSLYNYGDVAFIINQVENDFPYNTAMKGWLDDTIDMTDEEKEKFVFLTPVDLSTLIALYGDSSTQENKQKYINLLQQTQEKLTCLFGRQPFYDPEDMPEYKIDESNTNNSNSYNSKEDTLQQ